MVQSIRNADDVRLRPHGHAPIDLADSPTDPPMKTGAMLPTKIGPLHRHWRARSVGQPGTSLSRRCTGRASSLLDQLILWSLFGAVVGVVVFWQRRPFTSIGWHGLQWSSFAWGFALGALYIWALGQLEAQVLDYLELGGLRPRLGTARWLAAVRKFKATDGKCHKNEDQLVHQRLSAHCQCYTSRKARSGSI